MNILRNVSLALSLAFFSSTAFAQQLVTVSCDKGSQVTITYDAGQGPVNDTWTDVNGNGSVDFSVPDGVIEVTVRKYSDNRHLTYKVYLSN
jgi:hypothetical protein